MLKLEYSPANDNFILIQPGGGSLRLSKEEIVRLKELLANIV